MVKKLRGLRTLITGGAGFIGSNLADNLLRIGSKVVCFDNFNTYYSDKEKNVQHNLDHSNYRLVKSDILDLKSLQKTLKDIDIIFHLAAQPGVRYSLQHPFEVSQINIGGTINVLEAARLADVNKFIFASSSSVYGNPKYLPLDELHPTEPISPYGLSKLTAEKYCELYGNQYGMKILILRYFTVYGPRQRPDMAIHKFVKSISDGKSPTIYGNGEQTRDFTYISDIVDGTLLAAEKTVPTSCIFNLGGGNRVSVNKLIHLLNEIYGKTHFVKPLYEPDNPGDVIDTNANVGKASKFLGYKPKISLKEGLRNFMEWFKSANFDISIK